MKYLVTAINSSNKDEFIGLLHKYGLESEGDVAKSSSAWIVDMSKGTYNPNPEKGQGKVLVLSDFMGLLPTLDMPFKVKKIQNGFFVLIALGIIFTVVGVIAAFYAKWAIAFAACFVALVLPLNVLVFYIAGKEFDTVLKGFKTVF